MFISTVDIAFIIGSVLAALPNLHRPRSLFWLLIVGIDYALSDVVWRTGFPHAEGAVAVFDACVVGALWMWGESLWEEFAENLFKLSAAVGLVYLLGDTGLIPEVEHEYYSIVLELINALFLLLIGGTGIASLVGIDRPRRIGAGGRFGGIVRGLGALASAPRSHPHPFHQKRR